jgi:hypothetical protein
VLIKLCGRQISKLPPGQWRGVARLSCGTPEIARILYEGPATVDVQYAVIGRTPTARPRLGDPIHIAGVRVLDHDWPRYDLWRHLQPDGSLIVDTFILELFDREGTDQSSTQPVLPSIHTTKSLRHR